MSKANLTDQQHLEIAHNNLLSLDKIAALYNTSRHTVVMIKNEHGTSKGRGRGCRSTGFKVSDQQKAEIIESKIPYDELALIYNVHPSTIGKIKRNAGVFVNRRNHNRSKLIPTDHQLERIKDLTISARSLSPEIGISAEWISRKRTKLGLSYRAFQATQPKAKRIQKPRPYKPRPKKDKPVKEAKVITPKEIVKKLKTETKRAAMVKSKFEEFNEAKRKAEKAKLTYQELEAKQRAEGYRFVTRMGRHGIRETVWTNKN